MIDLEKAKSNKEVIVVDATIFLKSSAEGGRNIPVVTGLRPNHCFEKREASIDVGTYIGEIQFSHKKFIYPGESCAINVIFLKMGDAEKYLTPGRRWYIYEGLNYIAEAEVLRVY